MGRDGCQLMFGWVLRSLQLQAVCHTPSGGHLVTMQVRWSGLPFPVGREGCELLLPQGLLVNAPQITSLGATLTKSVSCEIPRPGKRHIPWAVMMAGSQGEDRKGPLAASY